MDIQEFLSPYQSKLKGMYDKALAADEVDHEAILEAISDEIESNDAVEDLGRIRGVIHGYGINWIIDCVYYVIDTPINDEWWMFYLLWDDNDFYWTVQKGGSLPNDGQTWEEAAYALLEKYAEPGSDESSIRMYNELMDDWRRIADKNDPLTAHELKILRIDRWIDQTEEQMKRYSPDAYLTDCVLTASELDDFLLAMGFVSNLLQQNGLKMPELMGMYIQELAQPTKSLLEIETLISKQMNHELIASLAERLNTWREPKRQFLCELLIVMTTSEVKAFSQSDKTKWVHFMSIIGGGDESLFLQTVWDEFVRFCNIEDPIEAKEFRPRWPFRPLATEKLFDANGVAVPTMNSNGQLIFWAKNEAAAKHLAIRLNQIGETYILSAHNQAEENLCEPLGMPAIPSTGDLIKLIFDSELVGQSTEKSTSSPIAWLLGLEFSNVSKPKVSAKGFFTKEFTFDVKSGKKGLFGFLSSNPKIKLEFNCNYYPYTDCLESLFCAEVAS